MVYQLSDAIKNLFQDSTISAKIDAARLEKVWMETVGDIVSENTKIVKIIGNKLTVKTSGPAWRNELMMRKPEILEKLNEIQKKITIKEITFI
ncbi:MAG: DUF721 domain-containing protein [Fidelibacterota bacterium]